MYSYITFCNCVRETGSCLRKVADEKCPSGFNVEDAHFKKERCDGRFWLAPGIMSTPRREVM